MKLCIHRIRELEATVEAQEGDIAAKTDAIEAFLATAAGGSSDQASGKTAASGGADQEASSCSHQTTYGEGRAGWMPKMVKLVRAYEAGKWSKCQNLIDEFKTSSPKLTELTAERVAV